MNLGTIRYYEREGLMPEPPRTAGRHGAYAPSAAKRLRFIKRAQELGFTLAEIKELLGPCCDPQQLCTDAVTHVDAKLSEVETKIRHLQAIKRSLTRLKNSCDGQCYVSDCPILESLDTEVS
jgi:MerR family transcriptional regulator, copper efflux regulator